jgi:hypothetical protein
MMKRWLTIAVGVAASITLGWLTVQAATNLIPGSLGLIKTGKLIKGVHKGSFALPGSVSSATLSIFDTGSPAGSFVAALDEGSWKGLGKPAGSKGYKFSGDPCGVLIKSKVIKYTCRGSGSIVTPLDGNMGVVLTVGDQQYCAVLGGTVTKNDDKLFKATNAPAPVSCPGSPSGAFLD